jgi:hypothetical protein
MIILIELREVDLQGVQTIDIIIIIIKREKRRRKKERKKERKVGNMIN